MNRLEQLMDMTRSLSDQEFETLVAQTRTVRQARREGIAYERAMHTATLGVSTRWAYENSPEGVSLALIRSYALAGLNAAEIEQLMREHR